MRQHDVCDFALQGRRVRKLCNPRCSFLHGGRIWYNTPEHSSSNLVPRLWCLACILDVMCGYRRVISQPQRVHFVAGSIIGWARHRKPDTPHLTSKCGTALSAPTV